MASNRYVVICYFYLNMVSLVRHWVQILMQSYFLSKNYVVLKHLFFVSGMLISSCCLAQLPVTTFHNLERDKHLLASGYHCLAQDEFGFMWFGSNHGGGLYRYDGYELNSFVIDPDDMRTSLASNRVVNILTPNDGHIYIGSWGGLNIMDLVTGDMRVYGNLDSVIPDWNAYYSEAILKDPDGTLWIGTGYGLSMNPPERDTIHYLRPKDTGKPGHTIEIIQDRLDDNVLWLGSLDGLYKYYKKENRYELIRLGHKNYKIYDLQLLTDQEILVATSPPDIFRVSTINHQWTHIEVPKIPNDNHSRMLDICIHDEDEIWVSSDEAICLLNLDNGDSECWLSHSQSGSGLYEQGEFREMHKDRHGRLWIASWFGVQYSKDSITYVEPLPRPVKVQILQVTTQNDRKGDKAPLLITDSIFLRRDQRDVTIKYVLPLPINRDAVNYAIKLDGYDENWFITNQRSVRYPKLPGGIYHLKIKGRESDKDYTEVNSIYIEIQKTLIEKRWFQLGIGFMILSSLIGINRFLVIRGKREERLKSKYKQQINEIQMQALRAQMNPHFLFNCLNSIKYYAISKTPEETADYLSKFALLVRTILKNSKSHTIAMKDEIEALRLYVQIENLRREDKFSYRIEIDDSLNMEEVRVPPMIFQPYIENAIWHGLMNKEGKGQLLIRIQDLGNVIQCMIEDDGIGRAEAMRLKKTRAFQKKSMGMQITQDRMALINEIYNIDTSLKIVDLVGPNGNALGTRVIIEIPVISQKS